MTRSMSERAAEGRKRAGPTWRSSVPLALLLCSLAFFIFVPNDYAFHVTHGAWLANLRGAPELIIPYTSVHIFGVARYAVHGHWVVGRTSPARRGGLPPLPPVDDAAAGHYWFILDAASETSELFETEEQWRDALAEKGIPCAIRLMNPAVERYFRTIGWTQVAAVLAALVLWLCWLHSCRSYASGSSGLPGITGIAVSGTLRNRE